MGRDVSEWSERMVNHKTSFLKGNKIVSENIIQGGRTPAELLDIFKSEQKNISMTIDDIIRPLTDIEDLGGEKIFRRLEQKVIDKKEKLAQSEQAKQTIKEAREWLRKEFFDTATDKDGALIEIPKFRKIKELQDLKRNIYEDESGIEALSKMKREVAKNLNDIIKDSIENSKELSPEARKAFFQNWQKSGDLAEAAKVIRMKEAQGDSQGIVNLFNSYLTRNSLAAIAISTATGASPLVAAAVGRSVEALATNPRIASPVSRGLLKLAEGFKKNPDRWERVAHEIAASAAVSSDAFEEALISASAEVELAEQPLARTTEEVIRRKASILTRLEKVNPEVADSLRNAIENNDRGSIGGIMASLAEQSKSGIIQEGIGWDGHAVTESEVQKVESWISSIRDVRKRSNLSKQFGADRKLPEEMLQGSSGQTSPSQFIYQKARDKVRNPEY
jgi:hypothetical protein